MENYWKNNYALILKNSFSVQILIGKAGKSPNPITLRAPNTGGASCNT
jgi:hypothetical protein